MSASAPAQTQPRIWPLALLFACLAALVVGRPLLAGDQIYMAVDHASEQLPWSAVLDPVPDARNQGLADQGLALYPAYRYVTESWTRGELPLWNPGVHAGVPALANPHWGVADPQVGALVLLEALGGRELFNRGFAWLACLRLFLAGLGCALLARRLGLATPGACLAGVGFALSGFLINWLNSSAGHVAPYAPWLLLAVDRVCVPRPDGAVGAGLTTAQVLADTWSARDRTRGKGVVAIAIAAALCILGGHPGTAICVGWLALFWALAHRRSHGKAALAGLLLGALACAFLGLPFLEYLLHSGAWAEREAARGPDLLCLGALLALAVLGRVALQPSAGQARPLHAIALALAVLGVVSMLAVRGLPAVAGASLLHDLHGAPGLGAGYGGPGTHVEVASAWLPTLILGLALAACLTHGGALRGRALWIPMGLISWLICIGVPGLDGLWRHLPLLGSAASTCLAVVSALCLSLLAGEALQSATPRACAAAALVLAALMGAALVGPAAPAWPGAAGGLPELAEGDAADESWGQLREPPLRLVGERALLAGWVNPRLPITSARLELERLDGRGVVLERRSTPVELRAVPQDPLEEQAGQPGERVSGLPAGAWIYSTLHFDAEYLAPGWWRSTLVLQGRGAGIASRELGRRKLGLTRVDLPRRAGHLSLALSLASLALIAGAAQLRRKPTHWVYPAIAVAHGLFFALGANPPVPAEEAFPATRTIELLRERQGFARVLGGPGVLPRGTALVHGLRGVDGDVALDVAAFRSYRPYALKPGGQPLFGWNARGVQLTSPALRMLGVEWIALARPIDVAGWELRAAPDGSAADAAETYIYQASDPLPRALCVPRVVPREDVLAAPMHFDPAREAFLDPGHDWLPHAAFTSSTVEIVEMRDARVSLAVEIDGDGLLVLFEQHFEGWRVTVDGEERDCLRINALFRGVALAAGHHEVVFSYEPDSLKLGGALSLLALLLLTLLGLRARRAPPLAAQET